MGMGIRRPDVRIPSITGQMQGDVQNGGNTPPKWQLPWDMPDHISTQNSDGTMKDAYSLDVTGARPESQWLKNEQGLAANQYSQAQDNAYGQNLGMVAGAQNNLAASGGLSSGAAERLQMSGNQNLSNQNTGLANQYSQQLGGLRSQDIEQQINADQYNIGNALGGVDRENAYNIDKFGIQASAYGNEQLANRYRDQAQADQDARDNEPGKGNLGGSKDSWYNKAGGTISDGWKSGTAMTYDSEDENSTTPWKRW